ncbi:MAG: enoyl-CoA hydratase/isomerase family protein [Candidatus Methylomirabilia bacterium]
MRYSAYQMVEVKRDGTVLVLTLNRPEKLNAINATLHAELARIFGDVARDPEARAIVLTGAGRAFSAGGDVEWFQELQADPRAFDLVQWEARKIISDLLDLEAPLIAAVNGHATGLGATLALFCDTIFMADTAKIGDPHVKMGIVAGDGGAVIWPWLVGPAHAKEYLMTGDLLAAQEAERIGLVNHVVPAAESLGRALEFAHRLAGGPILAVKWTKVSVNKLLKAAVNLVLDTSLALEAQTFRTEDHHEAVRAFVEKRSANFQGR